MFLVMPKCVRRSCSKPHPNQRRQDMLKEERFKVIMKRINLHNKVLSVALSKLLNVSEDTIRRDLKELADGGHITIFTVSPRIAISLSEYKNIKVSTIGGELEKKSIEELTSGLITEYKKNRTGGRGHQATARQASECCSGESESRWTSFSA